MVPLDIAIDDLDAATWKNTLRLLAPPPRPGVARRARRGAVVLFIEGGACVKALRLGEGRAAARLDPAALAWQGPRSLPELRRRLQAPIAVALSDDVLTRIAAVIDRGVVPTDDLIAQLLVVARAVKDESGRGLQVDPDLLALAPVPSLAALQRTWELLLPDDRAVALFVFDRGAVWASLVLEKRRGEAVRLTTHGALGALPGDFRGGRHREILRALELRVARPHAAIFCSLDAWREIVGPDPGALATQFALGQVVLDPAPSWLYAFAGAGAMAGMAQGASRLFGRFVPQVVKDTAKAMSPFAALGFDPIELFTRLRKSL